MDACTLCASPRLPARQCSLPARIGLASKRAVQLRCQGASVGTCRHRRHRRHHRHRHRHHQRHHRRHRRHRATRRSRCAASTIHRRHLLHRHCRHQRRHQRQRRRLRPASLPPPKPPTVSDLGLTANWTHDAFYRFVSKSSPRNLGSYHNLLAGHLPENATHQAASRASQ